ncbi:MAG: PilT/PilU family type 4a pilus ATPase [Candidatus Omnitrophica bacterium]|nr:PilT/PilU family type 4a pilus ATPase [Candidatus Omnitrophota bacterium]
MRDPVCGMEVVVEQGEQAQFSEDHAGTRYVFCAEACRRVFLMKPERFLAQQPQAPTGHCELCRKTIHVGETVSPLTIRGSTYQFCCPTCASVFLSQSGERPVPSLVQSAQQPDNLIERLTHCGLLPWLEQAVRQHASDLFLAVADRPTLKVYGSFKPLNEPPLTTDRMSQIIEALLPEAKRAQFLEGREVDVGIGIEGLSRFRVNVFREQDGQAIAFRPLPHRIPTLAELGLPPIFESLSRCSRGLILVTGPAGSGKSTTLAALIDAINQQDERHIITIEDPIEYVFPNKRSLIHQRELDAHTRSFADGLRSALREHPDIIMVGELRDRESIALAVRAAETGHLVLGTLHSGTTIQAVTRILDVFEAELQGQIRIQLTQSLQAIVAQRLLKRRDGSGMVAATEVLLATLAVRNVIRRNALHELRGYIELGVHEGMHALESSIKSLVTQGIVGEEALREAASTLVGPIESDEEPRKRPTLSRWLGVK